MLYLAAFSGGNPLNTTMAMETHGLKCPPDVLEQIKIASKMPIEYPNPICRIAVRMASAY